MHPTSGWALRSLTQFRMTVLAWSRPCSLDTSSRLPSSGSGQPSVCMGLFCTNRPEHHWQKSPCANKYYIQLFILFFFYAVPSEAPCSPAWRSTARRRPGKEEWARRHPASRCAPRLQTSAAATQQKIPGWWQSRQFPPLTIKMVRNP